MEVINCAICGKGLKRSDFTMTDLENEKKAVYYQSFGAACLSHKGVAKMFTEVLEKAEKELDKLTS